MGNNGQNNVVSYVGSGISSFSADIKTFILDALTRGSGFGNNSWYLTSMQMGFEPWIGGVGLAVNSFSASVTRGSGNPTATRTPTPGGNPTATRTPNRTPTPGGGSTCSPVNATISAPFTRDGAGTFCWQSSNLGSFINSWSLSQLTINGIDFTNKYVAANSYPPKINGYWYIRYIGNYAWSHFEAK